MNDKENLPPAYKWCDKKISKIIDNRYLYIHTYIYIYFKTNKQAKNRYLKRKLQ